VTRLSVLSPVETNLSMKIAYSIPFFRRNFLCYFLFLENFSQELLVELCVVVSLLLLGAVYYFARRRISNWLFGRKVKPNLKEAIDIYEKEILPEFVTGKPKITPIEEKGRIPPGLPYGYIFVPKGQEELIWETLITHLPASSSLRRIKVLFDKDLRESLFDVLSYQLGLKLGREEVAVKIRDIALERHEDDFEIMEKLYSDGKLTNIILWEAGYRFQKSQGQISTSNVKEFSTLVRKLAQIEATVIRVGEMRISRYIDMILEIGGGIVLLARGQYTAKALEITAQLFEKGYELYTLEELGFANPEIGRWTFKVKKGEVAYVRVWLKRKNM